MSTWLYRLGAFSARRAWLVIVSWLVVLAAVLGSALALGPNMRESFEMPGTESQEALDRLTNVFPEVAGAAVQVVVHTPNGEAVERYRDDITALETALEQLDHVENVLGPWDEYAKGQISDDDTYAYIQVQYDQASYEVSDASIDALVATAEAPRSAGLAVEFSSQIFAESSVAITLVEVFGVLFAAVVLIVTFWSFVAAGLPLLMALIGVGITMGGILLASALTTVSNSAPLMALMIGLAVGIDYALFILTKHRSQLAAGLTVRESIATAVGTAGTAVAFAGITVVVALAGLLIVGIPFLSVMGLGAAAAVVVAVLISVTLLPAVTSLVGEKLRPKPQSKAAKLASRDLERNPTAGMRWVRMVTKAPLAWVVGVVALVGICIVPAAQLQLALPDNGGQPRGSTAREAYDMLQKGFGDGAPGPLIVMVDITQTTDIFGTLDAVADDLAAIDGVAEVGSRFPDRGADTAIIQVLSEHEPSSPETTALVERIRAAAQAMGSKHDVTIAVTGFTAVAIDLSSRLGAALVPFGIVVVLLSLALLLLVFRSIWVPVIAAGGFLLSLVAGLGVPVAVLQWGWGASLVHAEPGPLLSFMPVILMAVLFGLAMDYQMFLVSGIREAYVHGRDPRSAIEYGFAQNARVVSAAAIIMFFVFVAFVPEGMVEIKAIALGLAVGVAVDAFLVRMTLVPALLALLGKHAWWIPRWLNRVLPDADVEGAGLHSHIVQAAWAERIGGQAAMAGLVVGDADIVSRPLTARITAGELVEVDADARDRLALWLTMRGELAPVRGKLHVNGLIAPADAPRMRSNVAFVWVDEVSSIAESLDAALAHRPSLLIVDGTDEVLAREAVTRALVAASATTTVLTGAFATQLRSARRRTRLSARPIGVPS